MDFTVAISQRIDNVRPSAKVGFAKAELDGWVLHSPDGLHCRVTDAKPTPTPLPDDGAAIKVRDANYSGRSLTLHYQRTNTLRTNVDYQIECMVWSAYRRAPIDVLTRWVADVPAASEVEGTVYFPRGNESTQGMTWDCRITDAQIGHPGH